MKTNNKPYKKQILSSFITILLTVIICYSWPNTIFAAPLPGACQSNETGDYSSGFTATDFDLSNITLDVPTGMLQLQTGAASVDPNSIVIPFAQKVRVTFLYEGAGYDRTDFGWMYASGGSTGTMYEIYQNVNDNNGNGVLDVSASDNTDKYGDRNGDGVVNSKDNTVVLGDEDGDGNGEITFPAGTEIVFYLKVDNEGRTYYTKKAWNTDTWNGSCGTSPMTKTYYLDSDHGVGNSNCGPSDWLDGAARDRLKAIFDLDFDATDIQTVTVTRGDPFDHVMVGVPGDKPNEWVLGWEDLGGGGDTDYNDLVFRVQRETGGVAEIKSANAVEPTDADAYFTDITFQIYDFIECEGKNDIVYYLSIDNGGSWTEITTWDEVYEYDSATKALIDQTGDGTVDGDDDIVSSWVPGNPQYAYRKARIDFAALGLSGREFVWKAKLLSQDETCIPGIKDVGFDASVAKDGSFSRSTPSVMANMLYSGRFETARSAWTDPTPRGHLGATRLYDPSTPDATDPADKNIEFWDAGEKLSVMDPASRVIKSYISSAISVNDETLTFNVLDNTYSYSTSDETTTVVTTVAGNTASHTVTVVDTLSGTSVTTVYTSTTPNTVTDGYARKFSGTLANNPVSATTLRLTDSAEVFTDVHIDELDGDLGGSGTFNRYSGTFVLEFNDAPVVGLSLSADYVYYNTGNVDFTTANISGTMLGLDNTYIGGSPGYFEYDFNSDNKFNGIAYDGTGTADDSDADWLVNWVKGYSDGASTSKDWLLGSIDHSVPALLTAPGKPHWYFGTDINDNERESYDTFMDEQRGRKAVLFVGARDGMLHAFDAGRYLMEDSKITSFRENRGHFRWKVIGSPPTSPSCVNDGSWGTGGTAGCPPEGAIAADSGTVVAQMFGSSDYYVKEEGDTTTGSEHTVVATDNVMIAPDYGTGDELWAFIPANLIPRLKNNALSEDDQAFVDASPAVSDVWFETTPSDTTFDPEWKSVMIAAQGNGGDTVFCLDVTNPLTPTCMWEFGDPDLFRSKSSPAIAQIGRIVSNGKAAWAAFFVSGKTYADVHPAIYMVNIETGSLISKIELDCMGASGIGGVPSGQPAIVDSDGNGYIDRLYVGTDKGYMYKVNIPDLPRTNPTASITHCIINTDFVGTDADSGAVSTVTPAWRYQPIYGSPAVVVDNTTAANGDLEYQIRIFFGTSDNPYVDENIDTATTRYHFFAYIDTSAKGVCNSNVGLEWYLELDAGHRVFASAFAAAGQIYFGTSTADTEDPCAGFIDPATDQGQTHVYTLDGVHKNTLDTGNVTDAPLVDDQHLYIKTPDGIKVIGDNIYNNDVVQGGFSTITVRSWREIRNP